MSKFLDLNGLDYFWDKIVTKINDSIATKANIIHTLLGQNNRSDPNNDYLLMVGNGVDSSHKNTAFAVDADGNTFTDGTAVVQSMRVKGGTLAAVTPVGDGYIAMVDTNIDSRMGATHPSSNLYGNGVSSWDVNGDCTGYVETSLETSGRLSKILAVKRADSNGDNPVTNALYLRINDDGSRSVGVSESAPWREALNVVNKSGDTVNGELVIDDATDHRSYISLCSLNIDRDGANPSTAASGYGRVYFRDKDLQAIGRIMPSRTTAGVEQLAIGVFNYGTSEVSNTLILSVAKDGTKSYSVSDPAAFCSAIGVGVFASKDITTSVTVATATDKSIGSVSLAAGVWVISYGAKFPINSTGIRSIALNTSSSSPTDYYYRRTCLQTNAVSNSNYNTWLHSAAVMSFDSTTTIYLIVAQSSGSSQSVQGCISAVKIK